MTTLHHTMTYKTKCSVAKFGYTLYIDPTNVDLTPQRWGVDAEWHPVTHKLLGVGWCGSGDKVYYSTHLTPQLLEVLTTKTLYIHNAVSDLSIFEKNGVSIPLEHVLDTMHRSYSLDTEKKRHGLKDLCREKFSAEWASYEDMVKIARTKFVPGRGKKATLREVTYYEFTTLDTLPTEEVAEYCGCDALHAFKLGEAQEKEIVQTNRKVLQSIDLPLAFVIRDMEETGIMTDIPKAKLLQEELREEERKKEQVAQAYLGVINLRSPLQVLPALQKAIGHRIESTNEKTLQRHSAHNAVHALLEYRELQKLLSTYIGPILENPSAPLLRARFGQCVTATARLNSSGPNLQNIPSHSNSGKRVRELFVARPGMVLLNADYSQADLRMIAHWSQFKPWVDTFNAGGDIHQLTATEVEVERQAAKTLNLILANSGGSQRIAEALKIPLDRAKKIGRRLRSRFDGIYRWMEVLCQGAQMKGGITTIGGRFIPCPQKAGQEFFSWSRDTVSKKVQGSTADLARIAMVQVWQQRIGTILIQEHDALVVEVPESNTQINRLKEIMENALQTYGITCRVPVKVDVGIGKTWREAKGG